MIHTSYPSCIEVFKANCEELIVTFDSEDIVKANKAISLVVKIAKKHRLVFLPDFLDDFMNGMYSKDMMKKYHMFGYSDFALLTETLQLKGSRSKNPEADNMRINLQNKNWHKRYDFLKQQLLIFDKPLIKMHNCHVLQTLMSRAILNLKFIDVYDIKNKILELYEESKRSVSLQYNNTLKDSLEQYMHDDLNNKIDDVTGYFSRESYITRLDGDISLPQKYSLFSDKMCAFVHDMADGLLYSSLKTKILNEFPLIRIAYKTDMFDNALDKLEKKKKIVRKRTYWKYSPDSDQIFSFDRYASKMEHIRKEIVSSGRTKFFGRIIHPDQFIEELKQLEVGDLEDLDDQVTRIAGLVLSNAAGLQSPREDLDDFDFVVDLTNYNFRPEQEAIIKKLDFQIRSTKFHCKVMIKEKITTTTLSKLVSALPDGEQGIIFTCSPINRAVSEVIKNDKTVQIIGEEAIWDWCHTTRVIPCRRNSIAKVRYGDNMGKIVLVKSLNYESGLATVYSVFDQTEISLSIGSIEEIFPHVSSLDNFKAGSDTYLHFLQLLIEAAPDSFELGMQTDVLAIYSTHMDLLKNTHPELFDENDKYVGSAIDTSDYSHRRTKYIQFENVHVEITLSYSLKSFKCSCSHSLNDHAYKTLCHHLVAGLDYMCRLGDAKTLLKNTEMLKESLVEFRFQNILRSINAISDILGSESKILGKYLEQHANNDL